MNIEKTNLEEKVIKKLRLIKDLELPINIYDLGLIYKIEVEVINESVNVNIETTVINSRCNSTKSFTDEIINHIKIIDEVENCNVKFVFTPKWDVSMISDRGLDQLRNAS